MVEKYIVKNCPCIYSKHYKCDSVYYGPCKDCTDCLIKQVIERCKSPTRIQSDFTFGQRDKADKILQLFEIEEVSNDR